MYDVNIQPLAIQRRPGLHHSRESSLTPEGQEESRGSGDGRGSKGTVQPLTGKGQRKAS